MASLFIMGRNPKLFKDPLDFKPERWLRTDSSEAIHNFAWLPFGFGPRSCIGNSLYSFKLLWNHTSAISSISLALECVWMSESVNHMNISSAFPSYSSALCPLLCCACCVQPVVVGGFDNCEQLLCQVFVIVAILGRQLHLSLSFITCCY